MAITIDDFSKIWASTSPLTPYEFSEDNYKSGWNFVGGTPPSRQMWDFLQKNNDEKMQYLANNYLPLSGGTMSGNLFGSTELFIIGNSAPNTDAYTGLYGANSYNNGASVFVYGKDNSTGGGRFDVHAFDGTNRSILIGTPSGSLSWNGKEVDRVNASGTGYIRYENGWQLCYQTVIVPANTTNGVKIFTYPMPFVSGTSIQATPLGVADSKLITLVSALSRSSTEFQIQVATPTNTVPTYDTYVYVLSVGSWK